MRRPHLSIGGGAIPLVRPVATCTINTTEENRAIIAAIEIKNAYIGSRLEESVSLRGAIVTLLLVGISLSKLRSRSPKQVKKLGKFVSNKVSPKVTRHGQTRILAPTRPQKPDLRADNDKKQPRRMRCPMGLRGTAL